MSVFVMDCVFWGSSARGADKMLLLALADWSDDEGYSSYSVRYLAAKTGLSERSVHYAIETLVGDGELQVIQGGGRKRRSQYLINVERLAVSASRKKIETGIMKEKGANFASFQNPAKSVKERVQNPSERVHTVAVNTLDNTLDNTLEPRDSARATVRSLFDRIDDTTAEGANRSDKTDTTPSPGSAKPPTPVKVGKSKMAPERHAACVAVIDAFEVQGGARPSRYDRAIVSAGVFLDADLTTDDIPALYAYTASWVDGAVTFAAMVGSIDRWRALNKPDGAPPVRQKVGKNGPTPQQLREFADHLREQGK